MMESNRMFVVDAIARAERTVFDGEPIRREEKPEYRAAQFQHAREHERSESAAQQADISRGRRSSNSLSQSKRVAIMAALVDSRLSTLEIADQFKVQPATVETIKAELDEV
jgi:hypothetical protein